MFALQSAHSPSHVHIICVLSKSFSLLSIAEAARSAAIEDGVGESLLTPGGGRENKDAFSQLGVAPEGLHSSAPMQTQAQDHNSNFEVKTIVSNSDGKVEFSFNIGPDPSPKLPVSGSKLKPPNVLSNTSAKASSSHPRSSSNNTAPSTAGTNAPTTKRKGPLLRRGKWTIEEETYANRLIQEFKAGLLPLTDGTTLRTFLSKLLNCDPMR